MFQKLRIAIQRNVAKCDMKCLIIIQSESLGMKWSAEYNYQRETQPESISLAR